MSCLFWGEAISDPRLRQDQRWAPIRLELRAEAPHIDPDVLGLGLVARSPDAPQELSVRQQLAAVGDEFAQQRELRRGQVQPLAVSRHLALGEVDLQVIAERDPGRDGFWRGGWSRAPEGRRDPR